MIVLSGVTKYRTLDGLFAPGLFPVGFLMNGFFHFDGEKGEGDIFMLPLEVSIGHHVFVVI